MENLVTPCATVTLGKVVGDCGITTITAIAYNELDKDQVWDNLRKFATFKTALVSQDEVKLSPQSVCSEFVIERVTLFVMKSKLPEIN